MRIVSVGESVTGANVRFEHGGREYVACGASRGAVLARIGEALERGEDLAEVFVAQTEPPKVPSDKSEAEPAAKKGAKARG